MDYLQRLTVPHLPTSTVFESPEWAERMLQLGISWTEVWTYSTYGVRFAKPIVGHLADYESAKFLSDLVQNSKQNRVDCLVIPKLTSSNLHNSSKKHSRYSDFFLPYGISSYLDLTQDIQIKKEVAAHLGRTERKLTREIGPLELKRVPDQDKLIAVSRWLNYLSQKHSISSMQIDLWKKWLLDAALPDWICLLELTTNHQFLAGGLFYIHQKTFYYYSPVMTDDPLLRKYGPGKLFLKYLIQYAIDQGCDRFDLLQGDYDYKRQFNPIQIPLFQKVVPLTLRGAIYLQLSRLKYNIRRFYEQ